MLPLINQIFSRIPFITHTYILYVYTLNALKFVFYFATSTRLHAINHTLGIICSRGMVYLVGILAMQGVYRFHEV